MAWSALREVLAYTSEDVDLTLREYESKYGWSSADFIRQWSRGLLDHGDFEFSRWAILIGIGDRAREAEGQK